MMEQPAVCRWHLHEQPIFWGFSSSLSLAVSLIPGAINCCRARHEACRCGGLSVFLFFSLSCAVRFLQRRFQTAPTAKFTRQHLNILPGPLLSVSTSTRNFRPQTLVFFFFSRSSAVSSSSPSAQMSAKLRLFSPFSSEWVIRIVAAGSQVQPILFPPRLCVNPHAHLSPDFFSPLFLRIGCRPTRMFRCSAAAEVNNHLSGVFKLRSVFSPPPLIFFLLLPASPSSLFLVVLSLNAQGPPRTNNNHAPR